MFREALDLELKLLVNRKFNDYSEAQQWWSDNSAKYDERMINIIE